MRGKAYGVRIGRHALRTLAPVIRRAMKISKSRILNRCCLYIVDVSVTIVLVAIVRKAIVPRDYLRGAAILMRSQFAQRCRVPWAQSGLN